MLSFSGISINLTGLFILRLLTTNLIVSEVAVAVKATKEVFEGKKDRSSTSLLYFPLKASVLPSLVPLKKAIYI